MKLSQKDTYFKDLIECKFFSYSDFKFKAKFSKSQIN